VVTTVVDTGEAGQGAGVPVEDAEAFCARMRPRLLATLTSLCGNPHLAEDVVQETLARVWIHWGKVRSAHSPEAWAYRVARNLLMSRFRRKAVERRAGERMRATAEPPTTLDRADVLAVREAVARLGRNPRTAVVLRYYEDLSVADTAALMGCSEGNVKCLTSRAITAMRSRGGL